MEITLGVAAVIRLRGMAADGSAHAEVDASAFAMHGYSFHVAVGPTDCRPTLASLASEFPSDRIKNSGQKCELRR